MRVSGFDLFYKGNELKLLQMLKNIKSDYRMNYSPCPVFCKYNYYICTVFFMVLDLRLITKGES
ncbi:hypothetical protein ADH68_04010 [Muribaculum intestinale]|nr:hypothetical protein ADH68_04010 [Muribaculum intestinale]